MLKEMELGVLKSPIYTNEKGETGDFTLPVTCGYTEFMLSMNHREFLNKVVVDFVRSAAKDAGIPTDLWEFETNPQCAEIYGLPGRIHFKQGTV